MHGSCLSDVRVVCWLVCRSVALNLEVSTPGDAPRHVFEAELCFSEQVAQKKPPVKLRAVPSKLRLSKPDTLCFVCA